MCKILAAEELKPHRVRYYLEGRDAEFDEKMAEVLCVYRQVKILRETAVKSKRQPRGKVAIVSHDEKPGIQAIADTAPVLEEADPARTAIHLILDHHSAHISKQTKASIAAQPIGRFEFTFTPKHGSWLNLVEGFFSELARSVLRHIRVASKQELKDRITAAIDLFNEDSVVHPWSYMLEKAA